MALQDVQFINNNLMLASAARVNGAIPPISTLFEGAVDRTLTPVSLVSSNVSNLDTRDGVMSITGARVLRVDFGAAQLPTNMILVFRGLNPTITANMIAVPVPRSNVTDYSGIATYKGWRAGDEVFYLYLNPTVESRYWNIIFNADVGMLDDIFFGGAVPVNQVISKGMSHQTADPSQFMYSDSGRFYAVRRPKYQTVTALRLPYLNRAQITAFKNFSDLKGITEPFWIAIDPDNRWDGPAYGATFGAYRFATMPTFSHDFLDRFTATFSLREVL